ncbi:MULTISPECIES: hypothetical protein [Pseudomonas]|uniref:Uncharacterized protein n=2 Tax=Pseudomonas gessardii TaxID=78544 RepID=A0ABS9FCX2_9PSED|nr:MULTISPECIES: hypothetical protein [Pseudomonas]MBH3424316.1 hypothetical protein [Pseudomonas gessardii]MCF4979879.1 hypothetical protein [Pseudomonas gessardii]MCF5084924.1 hypothetical protein [Pseudomonas gessardii]MCF5095617.1 hypothetical protein [Pseudomonas gessardii]MCF5110198.1 hypothetical protein [Pseudomonas gessardii]
MNITPTTTMPASQNSAETGNTQEASQQQNPQLKKFKQFRPAFGQPAGRIVFAESNPNKDLFKPVVNFKG